MAYIRVYTVLLVSVLSLFSKQSKAQTQQDIDSLLIAGNYTTARSFTSNQLAKALKAHDTVQMAIGYINLGKVALLQEAFDEAMQHYMQALPMLALLSPEQQSEVYLGLGVVNSRTQQYRTAETYFKKALAVHTTNDIFRLKILVNLGGLYVDSDTEDLVGIYGEALQLADSLQRADVQAVLYSNLSNYYSKAGNWQQAAFTAKRSIALRDSMRLPISVIAYNNLGYALVAQDSVTQGIAAYETALPKAGLVEQQQLYYNLRSAYMKLGAYEKAIQYFEKYDAVKDSLATLSYNKKVAELNKAYETEAKEKQIALLETKNKAKENEVRIITIAALVILIFIIVLFWLRFRHFKTKKRLQATQLRQQLLLLQLNPHFLFNALQQLQHAILQKDTDTSVRYLHRFSRLMRIVLEHSDQELIALEEELELLQHYAELQQQVANEHFEFTMEVADDIATDAIAIPVLLLQPIVENAILHGAMKRTGGKVDIQITKPSATTIAVTITDNGPGIQTKTPQKAAKQLHRSMGSTLITQRIATYNALHHMPIQFTRSNGNANTEYPGTCVQLEIPFTALF